MANGKQSARGNESASEKSAWQTKTIYRMADEDEQFSRFFSSSVFFFVSSVILINIELRSNRSTSIANRQFNERARARSSRAQINIQESQCQWKAIPSQVKSSFERCGRTAWRGSVLGNRRAQQNMWAREHSIDEMSRFIGSDQTVSMSKLANEPQTMSRNSCARARERERRARRAERNRKWNHRKRSTIVARHRRRVAFISPVVTRIYKQ